MLEVINNIVMEVKEIVTPTQTAIVKEFRDYYIHTELAYVEGTNPGIGYVEATIYNYLNELQLDYVGDMTFECDGVQFVSSVIGGKASVTFEGIDAESYTVKTVNEGMRNGEVVFNV